VDGIHDLGGMQGFGPVEVEPDEPVFHEPWEGRTFALTSAVVGGAGLNTPIFRHAIERMDPLHYLGSGYYEHWLTAAITLGVEEGVVDLTDLERRAGGRVPLARPVAPSAAVGIDADPGGDAPRFTLGDEVRVRDIAPPGHVRCPGYVRGRLGVVARLDGSFPVPEVEAHLRQVVTDHTYSVRFAAQELWGPAADPTASINVDLYERYLEPAARETGAP
jgi:nitrile hydratase subunit beta